ncbi:MAG: extracellular solute-binding protein [Roseibium sp.]|uniref:extracellular solute-binding protein n=1 Tax=Roseibium sp. TaxID=1936156 RepID=UPI002608E43A|nr:extracellular solute-binding protein [Roseibium sp.]MCV0428739.1 extracellular solute-binding protein [Roseibium sp.]
MKTTFVSLFIGLVLMGSAKAQDELSFVFSSVPENISEEIWITPWENSEANKHGTRIAPNHRQYDEIKTYIYSSIESGRPPDVIEISIEQLDLLCEAGSLAELDYQQLESGASDAFRRDDFLDGTLHRCGVPIAIWNTLIVARASSLKDRGDSEPVWTDFFHPEKIAGNRVVSHTGRLIAPLALLSTGVEQQDVFETLSSEEGIRRTLEISAPLQGRIEDIGSSANFISSTENNAAAIGLLWETQLAQYDGIADDFVNLGAPPISEVAYLAIPAGSKNKEGAMEFIRFASSSERLAELQKKMGTGSPRLSSFDHFVQQCSEPKCGCKGSNQCLKSCCDDDKHLFNLRLVDSPRFWEGDGARVSETVKTSLGFQ